MFGVGLSFICSALDEIASSIGKHEIKKGVGNIYSFGFLSVFFGTLYFIVTGLLRHSLFFSTASLPFFIPRVILETLQMHLSMQAVVKADRGDFGFFRLLTIPMVYVIDVAIGVSYSEFQVLGMCLIVLCISALAFFEKRNWSKMGKLFFIATLSAITISLFRFDITTFNSVEAEQSIIGLVIALYFFVMAVWRRGEDPLSLLRVRAYSVQAAVSGFSEVLSAYAFLFAPAAVITAALRLSALLFSILSGRLYFHEKHFKTRLALMFAISMGLYLII